MLVSPYHTHDRNELRAGLAFAVEPHAKRFTDATLTPDRDLGMSLAMLG
jgi:hypothetical protein